MAGGQQITVGQGTLTVGGGGVTLALVGIAITVSAGLMVGSQRGQVVAVAQGSVESSRAVALVGQAITTGHGVVGTSGSALPALTGQQIAVGQGFLSAAGNDVTAGLSGVEADFGIGSLAVAPPALTGHAAATATGAFGSSLTVALAGEQFAAQLGTLAPGIDADDTFVLTLSGNLGQERAVALVGQQFAVQQGDMGGFFGLTGIGATVGQGTPIGSVEVPLVGQSVGVQQGVFGAPGWAALTGSQIAVETGVLYTTPDRARALTGQQMTVEQGVAVTSSLGFAIGQELSVGQQRIGPQTVGLVGQQIAAEAGNLFTVGDRTAALTGVPMTVGQGAFGLGVREQALVGQALTIEQTGIGPRTVALVGQEIAARAGPMYIAERADTVDFGIEFSPGFFIWVKRLGAQGDTGIIAARGDSGSIRVVTDKVQISAEIES